MYVSICMQLGQPRPPQLNQIQMQILRQHPHRLPLGGNEFVLYNLVQKQSNSGIFKNERLLVLNTRDQSIGYCSKVPAGIVPFEREEEAKRNLKEVVGLRDKEIKCELVGEKIVMRAGDQSLEWIFHYGNAALAKQWFGHMNLISRGSRNEVDSYYHKPPQEPLKQLARVQPQKPTPHEAQQPVPSPDMQGMQVFYAQKQDQSYSRMLQISNEQLDSKEGSAPIVHKRNRNPIYADPTPEEESEHAHKIQSIPEIQQIKSEHGQSNFQDFHQDTPLGTFVKGDSSPSKSQGNKRDEEFSQTEGVKVQALLKGKSELIESEVKRGLSDHGQSLQPSHRNSQQPSLIEEVVRLSEEATPQIAVHTVESSKPDISQKSNRQSASISISSQWGCSDPSYSISNSKILGSSLQKRIQLAQAYLSVGRRDDAVKELQQCVLQSFQSRTDPASPYFKLLLKLGGLRVSMGDVSSGTESAMTCIKQLQLIDESNDHSFRSESSVNLFLSSCELLLRGCQLSGKKTQLWQVGLICLQRCKYIESVSTCARMLRVLLYPLLKGLGQREGMCLLMLVESVQQIIEMGGWNRQQVYTRMVLGGKMLDNLATRLKNYCRAMETMWQQVAGRQLLVQLSNNPQRVMLGWSSSNGVNSQLKGFITDWLVLVAVLGRGYFRVLLSQGSLY